ncbi:hypothetical protein JYG23_05035 [Sedimentibacter sp. zth1]|uniref:hypothetical protein n=1 Tax=Sedimentibacter sp. zth1 TaxID=2816908 RepID=UPI001A90F599|nr:hypothetical protein [Sedimentibacter sp. zth1]QSX06816.1 hypothetical protein JYG23_05035 [Sedimentibacter sp. zth1]
MKKYVLGIDTSAYTTSIALVDYNGNVICNLKKNLEVLDGQKGLRQETAVFMHLNNLPNLINKINIDFNEIGIISVSAFPRTTKDSYMPVFVVGKNFAKTIAKSVDAEYIQYSHQENHISAAILDTYKSYNYSNKDIIAIHISGGTSEFLISRKSNRGFTTEIVGGSKDITFGQLIDRIGVYLNFKFPSGQSMQNFLLDNNTDVDGIKIIKPKISGEKYINLSGVENYYKKFIDENKYSKEIIIYSLFNYIGECIVSILRNILNDINVDRIIISGGVSANMYIRKLLIDEFKNSYDIIFPKSELSADNSLGNAMLPLIDRWYNEDKTN